MTGTVTGRAARVVPTAATTDAVPALLAGLGALVGAGAGVLGWSLVEARWYALREATVPVLEPGAAPLRVLHVSDLHLTPTQRDKVAWVRDLGSLEPDLVVDTGDNWAHPQALPALLEALDPLLERPGVFVMGSNDYFGPVAKNPARYLRPARRSAAPPKEKRELPVEDMRRAFARAGWIDLDNARGTLTLRGTRLDLVGTDDAHIDRDRFPERTAAPEGLQVGVTHAPYTRVLRRMQEDGVRLALAGHTHGGQLALPVRGALVTNCDLDTRRAKGLHGWPGARPDGPGGEGSMWLHVSAGLGTSPYTPVRFACRPEATLLTLVPRVR